MFAAYYNPVESKYLSENCSQASNRSPHHSNNSQHNNNSNDNENKNSKVKFAPQNNNSSFSSHNHHLHHNRSESYYNSCSIFNLVSKLSDIEQKRKKAGLELEQQEKLRLKQEQIHRLCAEKEKLSREKARQQSLLKQEQSCDALRRFYERKAKAAGIHCNNSLGSINCQENFIQQHHNNNKNNKIHLISSPTFSSINSSITSSSSSSLSSITTSTTSSAISIISGGTCSSISDSSSLSSSSSSNNNNFNHHNHINHNHNSSLNNHSNNNNNKNQRCRDLRQLVEKSRAALKINNFIIHHVRRRRTREVICKLGQLRQLELLLTQISESTVINQQRRIKVQEILRQLNNIDSNNSEVICYKKNRMMKMADGILVKSTNLEDFVLVEINECGDINEMW